MAHQSKRRKNPKQKSDKVTQPTSYINLITAILQLITTLLLLKQNNR